jgi:hypothetical protein
MKTIFAIVAMAASLCAASPALAQAPAAATAAPAVSAERLALAERVFKALRVEDNYRTAMQSVSGMMKKILPANTVLTDKDKALMASSMVRGGNAIWPQYRARAVVIYAETFDEDQLRAILAFYESPAGQTFIAKSMELSPKLSAAMTELSPLMIRAMTDEYCDHKSDSEMASAMCEILPKLTR